MTDTSTEAIKETEANLRKWDYPQSPCPVFADGTPLVRIAADQLRALFARVKELEADHDFPTGFAPDEEQQMMMAVEQDRAPNEVTPEDAAKHRESVAKVIYEAMAWAAIAGPAPCGTVPKWVEGGNSSGQDEARRAALKILQFATPEDAIAKAVAEERERYAPLEKAVQELMASWEVNLEVSSFDLGKVEEAFDVIRTQGEG